MVKCYQVNGKRIVEISPGEYFSQTPEKEPDYQKTDNLEKKLERIRQNYENRRTNNETKNRNIPLEKNQKI